MKAEIICIGTELLLGEIVDTNAAYLARELAGMGVDLYHKSTVGEFDGRLIRSKPPYRGDLCSLPEMARHAMI